MFYTVKIPRWRKMEYKKVSASSAKPPCGKKEDPKNVGIWLTGASAVMLLDQLKPYLVEPEAVPAMAVNDSIQQNIVSAFEPIIDLFQGLSYPVCFISLSCGMLLIMVGQRSRGLQLIKWGAVGYLGMQMVPLLMKILVDAGAQIK